jgi:uncharacterized protein YnzC (UPF0291/DUF896 family)
VDENHVIVAKRIEEKVNGLVKRTKERQLTRKKKKKVKCLRDIFQKQLL